MRRLVFGVCAVSAMAGAISLARADAVSSRSPVVSSLTYYPKPLHEDDGLVSVSFTTGRAARPGYEWGVFVSALGGEPEGSCTSIGYSWNGDFGGDPNNHTLGTGRHTTFVLGARDGLWCRGHLRIQIVEHEIGQEFELGRTLRQGSFIVSRVVAAPHRMPCASRRGCER